MTNSEFAALELQARIMGWEPAVTEDVVIEVPGPASRAALTEQDCAILRSISGSAYGLLDTIDFQMLHRSLRTIGTPLGKAVVARVRYERG